MKKIKEYKILLFIIAIFFGFIIMSLSIDKPEKMNIRGIKVRIVGEKNENVNEYLKNINYIDEYLINLCDEIILTDKHVNEEAGYDINNAPDGANALTILDKKTIYINTNSYDSLTMMHEFFHLLDYQYKLTENKDFISFINKHISHWEFSDYQLSSYKEAFVGLMMNYRYNIVDMREKCPEGFDVAIKIVEMAEGVPLYTN